MCFSSDICMIVEGGYPYVVGGVGSWLDAFMRASPQLTFHVIAIGISAQSRRRAYTLPDNVVGVTDVLLDVCTEGVKPKGSDTNKIREILGNAEQVLISGDQLIYEKLVSQIQQTGFGEAALLDSRPAWQSMEQAYERLLPNGPLIDFFWSWRFLIRSIIAIATAPLPNVKVFHAVATGFAGMVGGYANLSSKRPLLVTEHGIYTNERRIELAVADWLFESGAKGFDTCSSSHELSSIWMNSFKSFSRITYMLSNYVVTQYRANQLFQLADGAPPNKLIIIPNGIDSAKLACIPRDTTPRQPTVLLVGRIVPIKDIRTFIMSIGVLKGLVPNVVAILIGPEDEDPEYAAGCRQLVAQLQIDESVQFLGRVPDVMKFLRSADVLVLSSISEAQPIAILEAAAMGLPIVSTDVGSCRQIIEGFNGDPVEGEGGIVVEPCNPKTMAEALAKILLDVDLRSRMGETMRRRVINYYNKDRVKESYEKIYSELMMQCGDAT